MLNTHFGTNYFDLVTNFAKLDHKAIAEHVARNDQGLFTEAVLSYTKAPCPPWFDKLLPELAQNRRVSCIKMIRENANLGLKEAKDALDLYDGHYEPMSPVSVSVQLADQMKAWAGQIVTPEVKVEPTPAPVVELKPQGVWVVRDDDRYVAQVFWVESAAREYVRRRVAAGSTSEFSVNYFDVE
jgi:ribosomal protein L7/L12